MGEELFTNSKYGEGEVLEVPLSGTSRSVWGRRSTDLKSESPGSLALEFGSVNQRPLPGGSDVIRARR